MMTAALPRLVADCTLGKLATYLRLAGIDTVFDPGVPDAEHLSWLSKGERTILTRCQRVRQRLGSKPLIFILHDRPPAQIRQVLPALNVQRHDLKPLNRCSRCNQFLEAVPKSEILGCVADYVWQTHEEFKRCRSCGRLYWAGSHTERWLNQMNRWFEQID